ncbi:MAG: low molecular weight protein-tyrosine-phosphatase [Cellvibrionaceae bacterium]
MVNVLFVCLGNICRSPTAHGIFREHVRRAGLEEKITIDSAGTGDWHIGKGPDKRAVATAKKFTYDISDLRARQVTPEDFERFDYILAMDNSNLNNLRKMSPPHYAGELKLFLDFHTDQISDQLQSESQNQNIREVPDPYYGEHDGFVTVLTLIENASINLLQHIKNDYK